MIHLTDNTSVYIIFNSSILECKLKMNYKISCLYIQAKLSQIKEYIKYVINDYSISTHFYNNIFFVVVVWNTFLNFGSLLYCSMAEILFISLESYYWQVLWQMIFFRSDMLKKTIKIILDFFSNRYILYVNR